MSAEFTSLKSALENYVAQVAKVMEDHKAEVDAAVAKAVVSHDADCAAEMKTLQDEIAAASAKLVPPPFELSNQ